VALILATDGLPTDAQGYGGDDITQEFVSALKALEGLPVWIVIRLCTDDKNITKFYNNLDGLLELNLEVLDDFVAENREVQMKNPWLNYAMPMHRCRELGYHDSKCYEIAFILCVLHLIRLHLPVGLFDVLDERPLNKAELRPFCRLLFGTQINKIPDPLSDWESFVLYVEERLACEIPQWNPLTKKRSPWINVKKLNRIYNESRCRVS
jgi:hypothetical protein